MSYAFPILREKPLAARVCTMPDQGEITNALPHEGGSSSFQTNALVSSPPRDKRYHADSEMIYSPLFVTTEVSQSVHMLAAAFLIGPDRYLYWIYYPRRLMTYLKLKRLVDRIQQQTHLKIAYNTPMPRLLTHSALEFANYRYLPEDEPLSLTLAAIDHLNASYDETIRQLQALI